MFYLYKRCIGGRGVFWIGECIEEGKRMADYAANKDIDDYHNWDLCRYASPDEKTEYRYEPEHEVVYTGKRDKQLNQEG